MNSLTGSTGGRDVRAQLQDIRSRWNGREAIRLSNHRLELTVLVGGGHIAAFRFLRETGLPPTNVLWEAPWRTIDPGLEWSKEMSRTYGPPASGRFLAGFTGHALCLDCFGGPDPSEVDAGVSLHGEAAVRRWKVLLVEIARETACRLSVDLPYAGLKFERMIRLGHEQDVVYVEETLRNEKALDRDCDWVQHVTFGPPFLSEGDSIVQIPGTHGVTGSVDVASESLLAEDSEFFWPHAQYATNPSAKSDLRTPFCAANHEFLAGVKLDSRREIEFLLAINYKLGLGVGYCFRRKDFPWLTIWEENRGRREAPWNGMTQARGMEFGTSPLPVGRRQSRPKEERFGTPMGCVVPAHGNRVARYLMFLFPIPAGISSLEEVRVFDDEISIYDGTGKLAISIKANEASHFLRQ